MCMPNYINTTYIIFFGNTGNVSLKPVLISTFRLLPKVLPKHFLLVTLVTLLKIIHYIFGNTIVF